jgi:Uma2 family endonuclease
LPALRQRHEGHREWNRPLPDLSVSCAPIDDKDDHLTEPVVIIEILSPSTEGIDRGRKKFGYFGTSSVRQYAIVEQDERRVDLWTRTETGWINEVLADEAMLSLSSIGVEISLDAIYEDTDLDVTRQRANEAPAPAV